MGFIENSDSENCVEVLDFLKQLNHKVKVNIHDVYRIKKYYLSLYRAYMMEMYDIGYVGTPTCYVSGDINELILEMSLSGMMKSDGSVSESSDQVRFAKARHKNCAEDTMHFLDLLEKVLYYREACHDIDRLYDSGAIDKRVENSSVSLDLKTVSTRIRAKRGFPISIPVLNCLFYKKMQGKKIISVDYKEEIFLEALKMLGLEDEPIVDGMFVKELTHEEEVENCRKIFNYEVTLNGKYASVLSGWLKSNTWAGAISDSYYGLYDKILRRSTFVFKQRRDLLNKCIKKYGIENIVAMTESEVFCFVDADEYIEYPIGYFIAMKVDDTDVKIAQDDKNTLEGYTGEAYLVDYIENQEEMNWYSGCPIELYYKGKKRLFVDYEQTYDYDNCNEGMSWTLNNRSSLDTAWGKSWFMRSSTNIGFDYSVYRPRVFSKDSVEDLLFRAYGVTESGIMISKIPLNCTYTGFEKAKNRVFHECVEGGYLRRRKAGLEALRCKETGEKYYKYLLGFLDEFNKSQINALSKLFKNGYSFEEVWVLADPKYPASAMVITEKVKRKKVV